MIYEERFGKLSIFSSIFGKIENLEFSGLSIFPNIDENKA
jgi:hypothetical protein